ncbi:MAG: hypothetical protein ACOYOS_18250 [Syntrophales bacterium]
MRRQIVALLWIAMFFSLAPLINPNYICAQEKIVVGFGGLWTAGQEKNYPILSRVKQKYPDKLAKAVTVAIEKVSDSLPFNVLFETDTEAMKKQLDYPYSLAVAITRDDVVSEKFSTTAAEVNKTIVNVGMVIIIYQTTPAPNNQKTDQNTILFSLPLVGYFQQLDGEKRLTETEIDDLFIKTATKTIEDHLAKRLKGIRLDKVFGTVTSVDSNSAVINFGALQGMEKDNKVDFFDEAGNRIGRGTVKKLQKTECTVSLDKEFKLSKGCRVAGHILKGSSEDTYQVASFKISSKKAAAMFDEKKLGQQASQWFSDFLVARSGKAVLPSKLSGEWVTGATGVSFAVFVKDGQAHQFDVSTPKYPIHLDLTGVNSMMIQGNNVNEIWAYKAWLKVDIPDKQFSKKFDETASKNLVPGIQQFAETNEFFDLIHQLTAKAAMEDTL